MRDFLMVVKNDGQLEEFSRRKLLDGIARACRKRPVSPEQMEELVDGVVDEIENDFELEVPSSEIGLRAMRRLLELDQVAYIRFASVCRRFENVEQFVGEVWKLLKTADGAEQPREGADG